MRDRTQKPDTSGRASTLDGQFECGCWLSEVGCQRHPAITGTMCCPIHLKPYKTEQPERPELGDTVRIRVAVRGRGWALGPIV